MTVVTGTFTVPSLNGNVGASGYLIWVPTGRYTGGGSTIIPEPFTAPLDSTGTMAQANVDPTGPTWCWKVTEQLAGIIPPNVRYVQVPSTGPVAYKDLVDVDPATLAPNPVPVGVVDAGTASSPVRFIQIRRDTAANWTTANPVLALGEEGWETDAGGMKIGDGATHWASLAYALDRSGMAADQVAKPATGVAATDRGNLQAAIDATPSGGLLFIPNGVYELDSPLAISKHITIQGQSLTETWAPKSQGGGLNRPNEPFAVGAVLEQSGAGADVLQISGSGIAVHLRNLGLTWASAIRHTNTGHGVNAAPSLTVAAGGHDSGIMSFRWDNVVVGGHDGNHYAVYSLNSMYGLVTHLHSYGGGVLHVECDSFQGNYGNLVVQGLYGEVFNAGSADGVRLTARVTPPAAAGVLNLFTFIRPQVNITGAAATQGTQHFWNNHGNASVLPSGVDVIDPDLEGSGGNPIDFGGINSGTIVRNGGVLNGTPVGGYDRGPGANYQLFTASGSFRVPDGVSSIRVRAIGGGGGGGGGGSALTSGGITNQVGGGGGGAGMVTEATVSVTPNQTYTVTVGTGGTAGSGGAANGGAGVGGGAGVRSKFHTLVQADGGGGGQASAGNSSTAVGGGIFARSGTSTVQNIPGFGGMAQSPNGLTATPMPPGVVGGGGGGAATGTNGGGAGASFNGAYPAYAGQGGGGSGASATSSGSSATTPVGSGCGGGGGGGGAPGGVGGSGAAGAPGSVEVWW